METDDVPQDLKCVICWGLLRDPVQPSCCTHVFCRGCLTQSLEERQHCPLCRQMATGDVTTPPQELTQRLGLHHNKRFLQKIGLLLPSLMGQAKAPVGRTPQPSRSTSAEQSQTAQSVPTPTTSVHTPRASTSAPLTPPILLPLPNIRPSLPPSITPVHPVTSAFLRSPQPDVSIQDELVCELLGLMPSSPERQSEMLFSCPYCGEDELDQLDLLDHCNENHRRDRTPVVCPVCVRLPYGDPTYSSRNFIGHLNLRHGYYSEDFTDVSQSDAVNEQAAILDSLKPLQQN